MRGIYPWTLSRCVRPDRPVLAGRYPGTLWIRAADDGTLTVTVTLTFRQYLEGIAEVPPTWPMEALEAQVIAARSYVLHARAGPARRVRASTRRSAAPPTARCTGASRNRARRASAAGTRPFAGRRGQVLLYGGRPADTVYFSTSNGRTYGNDEVFGSSPLPYLRPVVEPPTARRPCPGGGSSCRSAISRLCSAAPACGHSARASPEPHRSARPCGSRGGGETRTLDAGHAPRHAELVGSVPAAGRLPERGTADDDPVRLVRRVIGRARPGRGRVAVGGTASAWCSGGRTGRPSTAGPPNASSPSTTGAYTRAVSGARIDAGGRGATGLRALWVRPSRAGATIASCTLGIEEGSPVVTVTVVGWTNRRT